MKTVEGAIAELGHATELASRDLTTDEQRTTGMGYSTVRFSRSGGKITDLNDVVVGASFASHFVTGTAGRFAFYHTGHFFVLCGFSDGANVHIALDADDPLAIETDVQRTRGKRKILIAILMMPTIIGLFFAFDILRAGQQLLKDNPRVRRPSEAKIRRRLKK